MSGIARALAQGSRSLVKQGRPLMRQASSRINAKQMSNNFKPSSKLQNVATRLKASPKMKASSQRMRNVKGKWDQALRSVKDLETFRTTPQAHPTSQATTKTSMQSDGQTITNSNMNSVERSPRTLRERERGRTRRRIRSQAAQFRRIQNRAHEMVQDEHARTRRALERLNMRQLYGPKVNLALNGGLEEVDSRVAEVASHSAEDPASARRNIRRMYKEAGLYENDQSFSGPDQIFARRYDERSRKKLGQSLSGDKLLNSAADVMIDARNRIDEGKFPFTVVTVIVITLVLFFDFFMHRFLLEWQRLSLVILIALCITALFCRNRVQTSEPGVEEMYM